MPIQNKSKDTRPTSMTCFCSALVSECFDLNSHMLVALSEWPAMQMHQNSSRVFFEIIYNIKSFLFFVVLVTRFLKVKFQLRAWLSFKKLV